MPRRSDGVTRDLEVVPEEAEAVRRLFALLARHTLVETADILNAEGVVSPSGRGWSSGAVRAVWSNRWEYLGFVTLGRRGLRNARRLGLDVERRPGKHPPIVTEEAFRDAVAGVEGRRTGIGKPKQHHKTYLLSGVLFCRCGARLWGEPRYKRRRDGSVKVYGYYSCPVASRRGLKPDEAREVECHERSLRADVADAAVLEALESFVLPAGAIDEARELLRERLRAPKPGLSDQKRKRLETRLVQLRKQHGWGDISDAEYLREKEATERELVLLPDNDKLVMFDRQRRGRRVDGREPAPGDARSSGGSSSCCSSSAPWRASARSGRSAGSRRRGRSSARTRRCSVARRCGSGAPGGIRTPDTRFRRPMLWSTELRARGPR